MLCAYQALEIILKVIASKLSFAWQSLESKLYKIASSMLPAFSHNDGLFNTIFYPRGQCPLSSIEIYGIFSIHV